MAGISAETGSWSYTFCRCGLCSRSYGKQSHSLAADALIWVALMMVLFILLLKQSMDMNIALFFALLFQIGYGFLRSHLYAETLILFARQMSPLMANFMKNTMNAEIPQEMLSWMQKLWTTYQVSLWSVLSIIGAFLGLILFIRANPIKWQIRYLKVPYYVVYLLIAALFCLVYQPFRTTGINLTVSLGMLYLIQGTAVLSYLTGDFFQKAKILRFLVIMAAILNYPLLVLISFLGILDVWFDFRRLNIMEEKHESNPD